MKITKLIPTILFTITSVTSALPIGDFELKELMKRYANDSLAATLPALPEADLVPVNTAFEETNEATTVITTTGANGDSLTTTSTITSTIVITIDTKSGADATPEAGKKKAADVATVAATVATTPVTTAPVSDIDDLYHALDAAGKAGEIADIKSIIGSATLPLSSVYPTCAAETITITVTPTWCTTSDDLVGPSGVHLQKVTILSTNTHVTTSTITVPVTVTFTNINGSTTNVITASSLIATGIEQTSIETITLTSTITADPTTYVTVTSTSTTYTTASETSEPATVAASDLVSTDAFTNGYQNTTNSDLGSLNIIDKRAFFD